VRRKWLLVLAGVFGLGTAVIVWLGVGDARQAALLDARVREAEGRAHGAEERERSLLRGGAPAEEVAQAHAEERQAQAEVETLMRERRRLEVSSGAHLLRKVFGW
jgi:hypothetical protein